jgi:hypothetical protein
MNNRISDPKTIYIVDSVLNSGYKLGEYLRQPIWRCIRTSVQGNLRDLIRDRVRNLVIDDVWSDIDDAALDYFKQNALNKNERIYY